MLVESFEQVYDDIRITEIIISDDCSEPKYYDQLVKYCSQRPKIKLFRNKENVGMSLNKRFAIERASNEWCAIIDSDNIIRPYYIDAFEKCHHNSDIIIVPAFAAPDFDYRKFSKWLISRNNVKHFLEADPIAQCLFNTCNYVVHRDTYIFVYKSNAAMKATDTIWFNYLWLQSGRSFYVCPEMEYTHRVHQGSGFLENATYNMLQSKKMIELIKNLV